MSEQKGIEVAQGENSNSADEGLDALDEEGRMRSQTGTPSEAEERFQTPPEERHCDGRVMDALLSIVDAVGKDGNRVRPITLELACLVTRQILLAIEDEAIPNVIAELARKVRQSLVDKLAPYVNTEQLFLEWFEDEYAEFEVNHIKLDVIGYELLLPPANTVMSGLPLHKRLPSGFEERIRTNILFYLHVRKLEREMTGEADHELPLKVANDDAVDVGDCINLNNSDLLSCTIVMSKSGDRLSRFLVTDRLQLILVEPDSKRAGWAVVRFVGLLQDTQISGDSTDSKSLHIVVEGQPTRNRKRQAVLTAKFLFDDHIRCMAAKQRLTKGRQTARTLKLQAICDALGIQRKDMVSPRNPFRIVKGCAPGSVRKSEPWNTFLPIIYDKNSDINLELLPITQGPPSTCSRFIFPINS
ncbi:hypothetical protein WR25_04840 [Diploscapter pachys]|uniref:CLEC16A/TT9 C-terminal domain-containing protein n=1 Tax=Diploscapter pachys TaxID=2018661 RepID=A0A2A2K7N1_9BILA|nr:hypothetical protein WR25_04840 [Diploscapter pachys]